MAHYDAGVLPMVRSCTIVGVGARTGWGEGKPDLCPAEAEQICERARLRPAAVAREAASIGFCRKPLAKIPLSEKWRITIMQRHLGNYPRVTRRFPLMDTDCWAGICIGMTLQRSGIR